jgi:hypothetical protein
MNSFYRIHRSLPWFTLFFGAFFCLFAGRCLARDTAKLRTTLDVQGEAWVGQSLMLVVELLSPGFFAGNPTFYLPRVPEVLILKPDERPALGSETIDGASYTSQRHEFTIFCAARRAGDHSIVSGALFHT